MNEDTRFILRRIENLEGKIMSELKELHAFKNKSIGIAVMAGCVGSLLIELTLKYM